MGSGFKKGTRVWINLVFLAIAEAAYRFAVGSTTSIFSPRAFWSALHIGFSRKLVARYYG